MREAKRENSLTCELKCAIMELTEKECEQILTDLREGRIVEKT